MGDSLSTQIVNIFGDQSVARIRGLENLLCFVPGAYAPGFMLPPASQASTNFWCKLGNSKGGPFAWTAH